MADYMKAVWGYNVEEELRKLDTALPTHPLVCIDFEFPGFLRDTPWEASEVERYKDIKFNVDFTKPIQLGITVSDGSSFHTWQFNFEFDLDVDVHVPRSIQFLRDNGVDFDKLKTDGINFLYFAQKFPRMLSRHRNLRWVTFHGLYDFAYATKLAINGPLPVSILDFTALLGRIFGRVIDIKYMARFCHGLRGGDLGLERLARILKVDRVGAAHQAGSDSLLTSLVFAKMETLFQIKAPIYEGFLYGITPKIHKRVIAAVLPSSASAIARPRRYYCYPPPFNGAIVYNAPIPRSRPQYMVPCNNVAPGVYLVAI